MRRSMWLSAALLVVLVACGGNDENVDPGREGPPASLAIVEPADGAEVETPFTVRFSAEPALGPIDTGASHLHLWIDGHEDDYEVIEANRYEIKRLPPGEHTISVSLRRADHSQAGAEDEITITVAPGRGSG